MLYFLVSDGNVNAVKHTVHALGNVYSMPYLLADGIYPQWPVFVKTIEKPSDKKKKHFAKCQEACRKDVERCFGALQARWRILDTPCRLWSPEAMSTVMHACVILHNMIVVDEGNNDGFGHLFQRENQPGGVPEFTISRPSTVPSRVQVADLINNSRKLHDRHMHLKLRDDLVEHLWELNGEAE